MAYVYQHVRKDKNQVFYIGIGSDKKYQRAYDIKGRNKLWYNIIKKTDYIVEIIHDNLSWENACNLEIELIKKYGKKCNNTGLLCNLTDGGEGFKFNHSEKSKKQISNKLLNKTYAEIHGNDNAEIEKEKRKNGVKKYWDSLSDDEKIQRTMKLIGKRFKQKNKEILKKCIHCGLLCRASNLVRWHNDNCKSLKK